MDREEFINEIERAIEMVEEANQIVDNAVESKSIQANYEKNFISMHVSTHFVRN